MSILTGVYEVSCVLFRGFYFEFGELILKHQGHQLAFRIVRRVVEVQPSNLILDFPLPPLASLPAMIHVTLDETALPGVHVCTALGSRGLTFALLCAELLAAWLHDEPLPVEKRLAGSLRASRFKKI